MVRVVESPAGEGVASFQLPWTGSELLRVRAGLRRSGRHLAVQDLAPEPADQTPRQLGEALFRALFAGQVSELFARSLGIVGDRGLRLRLRFRLDPDDPRLPLLHSLPWEILYQPDTRDFLGLSRRTPIVRSLEIPRPAPPHPLPSPLRVLVVPGTRFGLDPLDLEKEREQIQRAWERLPGTEVICLEPAGAEAIRQALLGTSFHILHFMGHGELDPETGKGVLFLEGPDGTSSPLTGESLAILIKDFRSLRLVFLNACETGRTPDGAGQDPWAGVATALVLGGLPAVIAMQLPVADEMAIAFSRTVYQRLAAGDPVDSAVSEGRQTLYAASPETADWAIPVLFTRIPDSRIFTRGTWRRPRLSLRRVGQSAAAILIAALAILAVRYRERILLVQAVPGHPTLQTVKVGRFRIARFEVTNRDYLQFVQAKPEWQKGRADPRLQDGDYLEDWLSPIRYPPGLDNHPVTSVSWFAAQAFCRWAGGDLPTQEQWQEAAHSAEYRFPWGPEPPESVPVLNFCDAECEMQHRDATFRPNFRDGYPRTAPVDAFPEGQTREGVYNLSGNVWEWCLNSSQAERVTMGGSFYSTYEECSSTGRSWQEATLCAIDGGFRCAWR